MRQLPKVERRRRQPELSGSRVALDGIHRDSSGKSLAAERRRDNPARRGEDAPLRRVIRARRIEHPHIKLRARREVTAADVADGAEDVSRSRESIRAELAACAIRLRHGACAGDGFAERLEPRDELRVVARRRERRIARGGGKIESADADGNAGWKHGSTLIRKLAAAHAAQRDAACERGAATVIKAMQEMRERKFHRRGASEESGADGDRGEGHVFPRVHVDHHASAGGQGRARGVLAETIDQVRAIAEVSAALRQCSRRERDERVIECLQRAHDSQRAERRGRAQRIERADEVGRIGIGFDPRRSGLHITGISRADRHRHTS